MKRLDLVTLAVGLLAVHAGVRASEGHAQRSFNRIASLPVFLNTDVDEETISEIVAATPDGNTLVYTDGGVGGVGYIDISDPASPQPGGFTALSGEPTSVAIAADHALVGVNTSPDFENPSGVVAVIDLTNRTVVTTIPVGGQPDSVAVSPDGQYCAVVLENERDEDVEVDGVEGGLPQPPAGALVVIELAGAPGTWVAQELDLRGIADYGSADPEPEYVDINADNIAAVTLQENNHIVLVDLATLAITGDFSAGLVDLTGIDTDEEDLIDPIGSLSAVPREPDAVTWIGTDRLATADEGDLFGGSRGFTIFNTFGDVLYTSGHSNDLLAMRLGHYPESRSGNKGVEPEAVEHATFGGRDYLFVGAERASLVYVYRFEGDTPVFFQALPTGVGPEGVVAIPARDLLVVASEDDARDDGIRSVVSLYQRQWGPAAYPMIVSGDRDDGNPIPWAALSGLTFGRTPWELFTVYDSAYIKSRIFRMDARRHPAVITDEIVMKDTYGRLAAIQATLDGQTLVNDDGTINVDPEGIALSISRRHFWVASEGAGTVGDEDRPFAFPNMLLKVAMNGDVLDVVQLPAALAARQLRFGFEGVAAVREWFSEILYVPFQRAWQDAGDPADAARIGRYDTRTGEWTFALYPLRAPASPNGGWVGLSGITERRRGRFLVLERDNQAGEDAAIKHVTEVDLRSVDFRPDGEPLELLEKAVVNDLIGDGHLTDPGGYVLEKVEGIARNVFGRTLVVNDNDGVDDSNGETLLLDL